MRDTDREGENICLVGKGSRTGGREDLRDKTQHIRIISTSVKNEKKRERERSFSLGFLEKTRTERAWWIFLFVFLLLLFFFIFFVTHFFYAPSLYYFVITFFKRGHCYGFSDTFETRHREKQRRVP